MPFLYLIGAALAAALIVCVGVYAWRSFDQYRLAKRVKAGDFGGYANIDSVKSKPHYLTFEGVVHKINPMDVSTFVEVSAALAQLQSLKDAKPAKNGEETLLKAHARVFSIACPSITEDHVSRMSYPQVAATLNLILEVVAGKANMEAEKKSQPFGEGHLRMQESS